MGFPIVNTPFTRNSAATQLYLHFLGNGGIQLHPSDGRELPPYPRHYPGPWLGPLSFVVRHTPVGPPCTVGPVGTSAAVARGGATNNMSQFRWHHTRRRRVLLKRPAGLLITVDDPMRRSHHPRACAPSCQQRYEVIIDGPMQFAFADPLRLPTSGHRRVTVIVDAQTLSWASHLAAGHVSDTPVTERFGRGCGPRPTVVPSAS